MATEILIPAEDITRQYPRIASEVQTAVAEVLPTGNYILGPQLRLFEEEYAAYCDAGYSLGISNGTEALHLALAACGVGPGDEVITVPNTYIATVFAISYCGATPVFVDVDPVTFNMDVTKIAEKITPRTKAILPVHLYGHPVDMDPLMAIAQAHDLRVVEDCAHAHGATYKGRKVGSIGDVGCFSFYPRKVMGCYGDGGAVTTNDAELEEGIRVLRYMGQHTKYVHEIIGFQQRLDELQAAILRVKLTHNDEWVAERRRWAALYTELLSGTPAVPPCEVGDVYHVYYQYTIRAPRRDELRAFLAGRGIGSQNMYPDLAPYQPAYRHLGIPKGSFLVADEQLDEILCLPMFPELTEDEVRKVAGAIGEFYA